MYSEYRPSEKDMEETIIHKPKVSIGLAVFNGEKYLKKSIESILAQTFTDFELIISDNASTDRTEEICRDYAARDPRIRYHRNQTNLGGVENANLTLRMSKGEYFRLMAHDDIMEPTLIEKSVDILDRDLSVVLCCSYVATIDENGKNLYVVKGNLASSGKVSNRFLELTKPHNGEAIYSLIRNCALSKTGLFPDHPEPDLTFLLGISLYGQFYTIPEVLFHRRTHPEQASRSNIYEKVRWGNPVNRVRVKNDPSVFDLSFFLVHYHWLQSCYLYDVISNSPLPLGERLTCFFHAMKWLFRRFVDKGRELYYAYLKEKKVVAAPVAASSGKE